MEPNLGSARHEAGHVLYNGGMISTALLLSFAACLSAQDRTKSDDGQGRQQLTPFEWKKPAAEAEAGFVEGKPRLKRVPSLSERAKDDEIVCEQGVLHPTEPLPAGASPAAAVLGGAMGVQHCWKKSDPNTIIKRPKSTGDIMTDAIQQSMSGAQVNSISGPGFKPLKKPRIPRKAKAKPGKPKAVKPAPAPEPRPAPAPEEEAAGETPVLLR